MSESSRPSPTDRDRRFSRAHLGFAGVAAAFAFWSLVGWIGNIPRFTNLVSAQPSLSVMTALALLVGAAAAAMVPSQRPGLWILGAFEAAVGVGVVMGHQVGLPQLDWIPQAAWSSPFTGWLFIVSGVAAILLSVGQVVAGQVVSFILLMFSVLIGLGYVFPGAKLYAYLPGTGVAIPTVLAFASLALSKLLGCRHSGIAAALSTQGATGRSGMRILLAGLLGVVLSAVAILFALRDGDLDAESALLVLTWCALGFLGGTLWALTVAVDKAEAAKQAADDEHERVRRTIAAAITHDLRSPLHTATLAATLLRKTVQEPRAQASLDRLQLSHRRLDRLLRSMLDNLAIAGGRKLVLNVADVELNELVREVILENSAVLAGRVEVTGFGRGCWDRDALFRVLENLLLNAKKYGFDESPFHCTIASSEPGYVSVKVENRGLPIPESDWENIFQPFARGGDGAVAGKLGWGVGLAFSRLVAVEHHGYIRVTSSTADKTVFELSLPVDAKANLANVP